MFDEIEFDKIKRLPKYVFASINEIKLKMRQNGEDVIDFSMGNPSSPTPKHIIDKLCEAARKDKNHGYSVSKGIYKLRLAAANWYKRKYNVDIDPNNEVCVTMGSKEGYVHLIQAITNAGDNAVVCSPAYPIHYYAFILNGANVINIPIQWDSNMYLDYDAYFSELKHAIRNSFPKPKFVVVNFPHNPTTVVVNKDFYERLVKMAIEERFYIISDIAYAELCFDNFRTPSILEVDGAKDVSVETYTLSKTYNMAGWRVGFVVGNKKIISALQKIKSWIDYGMYTPMQIASTIALDGPQDCVIDIRNEYESRAETLVNNFNKIGFNLVKPKASMFIWAKIPDSHIHLGSLEFCKLMLQEAKVAFSPGVGFGDDGEGYFRIALIENNKRISQATRNIKKYFRNS